MSGPASLAVRALVVSSVLGSVITAAAQSGGETHAASQGASAAEVIRVRQQGFKKIGAAFKVIHKELSGPTPDATKVAAAAADIKASTEAIDRWFPVGSGPEARIKTQAKAEIWTDAKGFAATRAAFVRQVEKSARQLGDPGQRATWRDSSSALGQSCRDCHDSYRVKG